jgi:tetratricopeptide (TPR) repeat protein
MKPEPKKQLSYDDIRHLREAEGWLELGDADSAGQELAAITPGDQTHPSVLQVRYALYAKRKEWDMANEMAEELASLLPDLAVSWINLAYATRRKSGGNIPKAKEILLAAEPLFPTECVIPFNLACYCSQLEEFEQAERWLKKAAAINEKAVRKMAMDDPDLKPLWESRGGLTIWEKDDFLE